MTNPCPRDHDESDLRVLANGQRICVPCRRLREKRKRTRRDRSWPFVELLPATVGYNIAHHHIEGEHLTGDGCPCLPDRIEHEETAHD